jgi:hypothetical protein
MKKSLLLLLLLAPLLCISQEVSEESSLNYYGEKVSSKGLADLSHIDEGSLIKVEGTVLYSCPKKGCWMQVKVESDTIQVMFKDYSFFVPKQGLENKTAIIEGFAKQDTISVEKLRHFAEDAGKSKTEINKIIAPKFKISFVANGVIIKQ